LQAPDWQTNPLAHANADPQPPQLFLSVCSLTHAPLHAVYPVLHWNVHALDRQRGAALETPVVQTFPQVPQSLTFVVVSTQVPLQLLGVLPLHVPTHVDATQTGVPAPHACPHELQFAGSLVLSTQTPPHWVYPESHAKLQLAPMHVGWACATEMLQWLPQAPQFERSVCASTQTPPPQGVCPLEQPVAHAGGPPSPDGRQTGPPESALHDTEQPPQCAAVLSWTQMPLQSV
jgi:hypothetical protein